MDTIIAFMEQAIGPALTDYVLLGIAMVFLSFAIYCCCMLVNEGRRKHE